jgi:hypothetical protein
MRRGRGADVGDHDNDGAAGGDPRAGRLRRTWSQQNPGVAISYTLGLLAQAQRLVPVDGN